MQEESSSSELLENEYYVEEVLDKKIEKGEVKYLIKWEGWPIESATWEPIENLDNIQNLIANFEKRKREKENGNKKGSSINSSRKSRESQESQEKYVKYSQNQKKKNASSKDKREKEESPLKEIDILTSLGVNVPEEVLSVKKDPEFNILCLVKFEDRADGIVIDNAYVPSSVLRDYYPKVLIKFYESKIKFVEKK